MPGTAAEAGSSCEPGEELPYLPSSPYQHRGCTCGFRTSTQFAVSILAYIQIPHVVSTHNMLSFHFSLAGCIKATLLHNLLGSRRGDRPLLDEGLCCGIDEGACIFLDLGVNKILLLQVEPFTLHLSHPWLVTHDSCVCRGFISSRAGGNRSRSMPSAHRSNTRTW